MTDIRSFICIQFYQSYSLLSHAPPALGLFVGGLGVYCSRSRIKSQEVGLRSWDRRNRHSTRGISWWDQYLSCCSLALFLLDFLFLGFLGPQPPFAPKIESPSCVLLVCHRRYVTVQDPRSEKQKHLKQQKKVQGTCNLCSEKVKVLF